MGVLELEELIPRQQNRKTVYETFFKLFNSNIMLDFIKNNNLKDHNHEELMKLILNLERGIFNASLKYYYNSSYVDTTWNEMFKTVYINKALTMYLNLNPNGKLQNTNLLLKFLKGNISEFDICKLDAKNLFPEKWNENLEKCGLIENNVEFQKNIPLEERPDGILKCGRCKSWKTEYTERQTRSADEPTSKFCYCHNCGNRWRFC